MPAGRIQRQGWSAICFTEISRALLEKNLEFARCAGDVCRFAGGRSLSVLRSPLGFPVRLDYDGGKLARVTRAEGCREAEGFRQAAGIPEATGYTGAFSVCGAVIPPDASDGEHAKPEFIAWDCEGVPGLSGLTSKYQWLRESGFRTADCRETVPGIKVQQMQRLQSYLDHYFGSYPAAFLVFEHGGKRIALRFQDRVPPPREREPRENRVCASARR